jgi:hypothetical protein
MSDTDKNRLERQFRQLESRLPDFVARTLRWLRKPASRWIRIPVAFLLIIAGVFGFLPVLGLWMLPLGVLLLAQDVTFLAQPTTSALVWLERQWTACRRRRRLRRR